MRLMRCRGPHAPPQKEKARGRRKAANMAQRREQQQVGGRGSMRARLDAGAAALWGAAGLLRRPFTSLGRCPSGSPLGADQLLSRRILKMQILSRS